MKLEELKNSWKELDERLKRNESLTESLILKMSQQRAKGSIKKLLFAEILSAIIVLLGSPLFIYLYCKSGGKFITWDMLMIFSAIICILGIIWQIYKIKELMKIDFSNKISDNIYNANRYNILIKREKIGSIVGVSVLFLLLISTYAEIGVGIHRWLFLSSMIIISIFICHWSYKKLYVKNINSILESLSEIKDINEDE